MGGRRHEAFGIEHRRGPQINKDEHRFGNEMQSRPDFIGSGRGGSPPSTSESIHPVNCAYKDAKEYVSEMPRANPGLPSFD